MLYYKMDIKTYKHHSPVLKHWRWGCWRHVGGKQGIQHEAVSGLGPGGWGGRSATPSGGWAHHQPCHTAEEGRHHFELLIYTALHPTIQTT